jgi:hypothetical protein
MARVTPSWEARTPGRSGFELLAWGLSLTLHCAAVAALCWNAPPAGDGVAELDENTVDEALKDVRTALLEADVGFDVVQDFCKRVKEKAVGVIVKVKASTKEKVRRVTPEDHFVKLCLLFTRLLRPTRI